MTEYAATGPSWKDPVRQPGESDFDVEHRLRQRIKMCERHLADVDAVVIAAKRQYLAENAYRADELRPPAEQSSLVTSEVLNAEFLLHDEVGHLYVIETARMEKEEL